MIIPLVIAVGGIFFNWAQDTRQQEAEASRAQTQLDAEERRAQDAALQAYFEEVGSLLLDKDLLTSQQGDEVAILARARTLTVLGRVSAVPKGSVVRFLYESRLIYDGYRIVSLRGADLRGAWLVGFNLINADLSGTSLRDAELRGADLDEANLGCIWQEVPVMEFIEGEAQTQKIPTRTSCTDLEGAYLTNAYLANAYLIEAELTDAHLRGADLTNAELTDANLRGTDLTNAELTDANLRGADLTNAELTDANLTNAEGITNEELEQMTSLLEGATMPDGSKHD